MIEYKIVKITDLGTVNRGKSKHRPRNDSILYGGKYPFIQTADIKKANLYLSDYSQTYNEIGLKQSKLWKKGTLCFTIAANIADSAILDIDACFPDSIVGFLPHENVSNTIYVKYLFDELKLYFQQISKGTTQDNLSLDKICRVKLRVPNYETQKKIALVLSTYDNLIENNNKRIKLLEQMAENLYKEWFVRFRFPGYEEVAFENGIPKGWEVKKIKNCVKRLPFNQLYKRNELQLEGKVIVIDQSSAEFLGYHNNEPSHCASIDKPILLFGDHSCKFVLMIRDFSLGENVVPFISENENKLNDYYLFYAVHKIIVTEEYKRHWGRFTAMKILVPNYELQLTFANFIKPIVHEQNMLWNENQLLTKQRNMLLPRLMSGKLKV